MWLGPFPDAGARASDSAETRYDERESLELAFVAALQHLPPRQRAVLILRDVLGFSGAEVGEMLDTAPSSVYSLLQRAHRAVDERIPDVSQQETLRALGDRRLQELAERYVQAWETADAGALVALLTEDAVLAMPPRPTWYRGRDAVGAFLARRPFAPQRRWRCLPARANGQVAFGTYGWNAERGVYVAHTLDVLTLAPGGGIDQITAFLDSELPTRFGLPAELGER
jgi:RNA polymerase sigma-70 factor (ECF subfamily)